MCSHPCTSSSQALFEPSYANTLSGASTIGRPSQIRAQSTEEDECDAVRVSEYLQQVDGDSVYKKDESKGKAMEKGDDRKEHGIPVRSAEQRHSPTQRGQHSGRQGDVSDGKILIQGMTEESYVDHRQSPQLHTVKSSILDRKLPKAPPPASIVTQLSQPSGSDAPRQRNQRAVNTFSNAAAYASAEDTRVQSMQFNETSDGDTGECDSVNHNSIVQLSPQLLISESSSSSGGAPGPLNEGAVNTFHGAREFVVNGGNFNSVAGNVVRADQRFYYSSPPADSFMAVTSTPISTILDPAQDIEEKDSEIYARLLWPKGRGYPLWCPSPNKNLPSEYLEKGIRIGDVGIITSNGEFDFLHNVCLPADHLVNGGRVPEGFTPICLPDVVDINSDTEHSPGSYLMSKSIQGKTGSRTLPPLDVRSDYFFQCRHHDGAILILPEGSYREDLQNLGAFRRYASQYGASWYRYANGPRGREAVNGSIHLVTGYDKSTAWALGAFSHSSPLPPDGIGLHFSANTVRGGRTGNLSSEEEYTYHWSQSGAARIKYGPMPVPSVMNQSLFVRTFCIELSSNMWTRIFGRGGSVHVRRNTNLKSQDILSRSNYVPFSSGETLWYSGSKSSGPNSEADAMDEDKPDDGDDVFTTANFGAPSNTAHPSRFITQYLLQKVPNANIAIVHHDNWKALIKEGEDELPGPEETTRRLEAYYLIAVDNDTMAVFLTSKEKPSSESHEMEVDARQPLTSSKGKQREEEIPEVETTGTKHKHDKHYDHGGGLQYPSFDLKYEPWVDNEPYSHLVPMHSPLIPYPPHSSSPPTPLASPYVHDSENYDPFSGRRSSSLHRSGSASSMSSVFSDHNARGRITRDFSDDENNDVDMGGKGSTSFLAAIKARTRRQRIESERRRRDELGDAYAKLKDVLPYSNAKSSKPSLLDRATNYIVSLEKSNMMLQERLKQVHYKLSRLNAIHDALLNTQER